MNKYNLIAAPKIWLIVPTITIVVSLIIIAVLRPVWGIDFVGGSLIEIEAPTEKAIEAQAVLEQEFGLPATSQPTQDGTIILRTNTIDNEKKNAIVERLKEVGIMTGEERRYETIGPTIGQELRRKTAVAVGVVVVAMIAYLAYEFRRTKGLITPWQFGVAATWALIHDLVLITALFVIFGHLWGAPIDTLFVTAQLAIMGYSVNDTIVVFERLSRERTLNKKDSLLSIINRSIGLTLTRSLNTGFTAVLTLVALLIFGGSTIRWFVVALLAGILTGTYSSIFVAAPALLWLTKKRSK
ncbi:MAG: protein translocase subunit SecF [Candidatus Andersenbacteria bacterium]|nr:protein translocase subunit SecF [Candidatus Andersenbacteria bacterium]MBI3250335.1 protein translocase subunit SecF [Candidatus Andersenbacteria bacterium]